MKSGLKILFLTIMTGLAVGTVSAQTYNFTTCDAEGRYGPSQSQCESEYSDTNLENEVNIVGEGIQEWTVPETGFYSFKLYGAQGAYPKDCEGDCRDGGEGGYTYGEIELEKGEILYVVIGQEGLAFDHEIGECGGFNGGGECATNEDNAGGGGATDIRYGGSSIENRILIAGGGGGGAAQAKGGAGGGSIGEDGQENKYNDGPPAQGGTQSRGGEQSTRQSNQADCMDGEQTSRGQGGCAANRAGWNTGGGGGGGYYGGGGGGNAASGGGGSSNASDEFENTSLSRGGNQGQGYAKIKLIESGNVDFCNFRGPVNECIMNQTNQLNNQQYNVSSIFVARSNAVFEAFDGPATLNLTNSTSISGLWRGEFNLDVDRPVLEDGAEFRPEGRIVIGR